jgi:hypothetical protein
MISPDRQERILTRIAGALRRESPNLVARFTVFERLTRNDGPPPPERARRS